MADELTEIQLRLPARAENVALVRQVLSGMADVLVVDPVVLADIKTAVTEACNNVVLHAYPGEDGTLEVEVNPDSGCMRVVVRDYGEGMQPSFVEADQPSLGLGLPLIAALSDRFTISGGSGLGLEVRMLFCVADEADLDQSARAPASDAGPPPSPGAPEAAAVAMAPGPMLGPVLGRLTAMLAARADFPLERLSDAVLVTDVIADNIGSYLPGPYASVAFEDGNQKLDLHVGPLREGGGEQLVRRMELPGLERSLEQLTDDVRVERHGSNGSPSAEYLVVRLSGN